MPADLGTVTAVPLPLNPNAVGGRIATQLLSFARSGLLALVIGVGVLATLNACAALAFWRARRATKERVKPVRLKSGDDQA